MTSCSSIVFKDLVSLTLYNSTSTRNTKNTLFPAASFPSLRAVYAQGSTDRRTGRRTFVEPTGLRQGQLDFMQVHVSDKGIFPPGLHNRGAPILFSLPLSSSHTLNSPALGRFEHFLFLLDPFANDYSTQLSLLDLRLSVQSHTSIKSICLPSTFSPSSPASSGIASGRDSVLLACASRKIDVVWRLHAKKSADDVGVSRDFWEYAKALKKKKKQLEVAAVGSSGGSK
jgi:hypothetical protein